MLTVEQRGWFMVKPKSSCPFLNNSSVRIGLTCTKVQAWKTKLYELKQCSLSFVAATALLRQFGLSLIICSLGNS